MPLQCTVKGLGDGYTCILVIVNIISVKWSYFVGVYVFFIFVNSSKYLLLHIIVIFCHIVCLLLFL